MPNNGIERVVNRWKPSSRLSCKVQREPSIIFAFRKAAWDAPTEAVLNKSQNTPASRESNSFPAVTSCPSSYPSLAKSADELVVCITWSSRGLTRHRCLLPLVPPSRLSSPPPTVVHPVRDIAKYKECMPRSGAWGATRWKDVYEREGGRAQDFKGGRKI